MQRYENINQLWAEIIVEELARCGVRHAVISPGSRSTPLVLALAAHPDITDHSVVDERSASFFALGLAKSGNEPVVLLCTSGTAAANYFPAVCEADASRVPLLLLTADRPSSLRDSGAPQTMDQVKLYGDRVRWFMDAGQPEADAHRLRALRSSVCQVVAMTRGPLPGPVHVNQPFRKPLEPLPAERLQDTVPQELLEESCEAVHGRLDGRPWLRVLSTAAKHGAMEEIADALLRARRPVILAGPDPLGAAYGQALLRMAGRHGIPVFAETASQLREHCGDALCFASLDLLLRSADFRRLFVPDLILQLGGVPTNSAAQRFLDHAEVPHFCIASDIARRDAAHTVSLHAYGDTVEFLLRLSEFLDGCPRREADAAFNAAIRKADTVARKALTDRCAALSVPFEGAVLHGLLPLLPAHSAVFVSSSMPIRDMETFATQLPEGCRVFFNRGVNGIDGIVSSALGVARGRGGPVLLVTGDIAFLHNLNAAAGEGLRDIPLVVLLLNNDGGEIFDMLPVREFETVFTRHFATPQGADFSAACAVFGITHRLVEAARDIHAAIDEAFNARALRVIEVRTTIVESGAVRRELLRAVAATVDEALADTEDIRLRISEQIPLSWRLLADGDGEAVLLLHGFTRSTDSWRGMLPLLGGNKIYGIDLMGHGASPAPDPVAHADAYRLDHAAEEIRRVIARLGGGRVHLVGYSLGGRTALHLAVRHPELLNSLALISANPGIEDDSDRTLRRAEDAELAARIGMIGLERFVDEWAAGPLFAAQRTQDFPKWLEARRDRLHRQCRGLQGSLLGSGQGAQASLWDALPALGMPVLVAAGADDVRYADIARRMAALLPDARHHVFAGAGHDLLAERPDILASALRELWKC